MSIPSSLTTSGMPTGLFCSTLTMPVAIVAVFTIPPNIFTKRAFTESSVKKRKKNLYTIPVCFTEI